MVQMIHVGIILLGALILYATLGFVCARLSRVLKKVRVGSDGRVQTIRRVVMSTGVSAIAAIAVIMILKEFQIDPTPLLASAGIAGLAVSFGAQAMVKDIFSGLFIFIENQYGEGDTVILDEVSGIVEELTLRKTVVRDEVGSVHHVPNGQIRIVTVRKRRV